MRSWWPRALVYAGLIAAEIFALFPFWWMITTSFKHQVEIIHQKGNSAKISAAINPR